MGGGLVEQVGAPRLRGPRLETGTGPRSHSHRLGSPTLITGPVLLVLRLTSYIRAVDNHGGCDCTRPLLRASVE